MSATTSRLRRALRARAAHHGVAAGAALGLVLAAAPAARAQQASALTSGRDSVAALADLEAAVRRDPRDAAAWHRKGMLAWALVRPRRNAAMMKLEDIGLARNADSSLRIAVRLAPDSARYAVDLSRWFLGSGTGTLRVQAGSVAAQAFDAARRTGDRALAAEARDAVGITTWRHYEQFANRYDPTSDAPSLIPAVLDQYAYDPKGLRALLEQLTRKAGGAFTGESDYRAAETAFGEAIAADPDAAAPRAHLYMLLAERARWDELRETARGRTLQSPDEALSWLALGLAEHRLGHADAAGAAFDAGLAKLPSAERARYTRFTRLLPPKGLAGKLDSARFAGADTASQRAVERAFWAANDPLSLTSVNEHRNDFLARVVFAELRWTVPELDLRGADTDRGDIFVRYGPPLLDLGLGPNGQGADQEAWYYPHGFSFIFTTPPGYGTARLGGEYVGTADQQRMNLPVAWDMDPRQPRPDSVAVQVARFRAGRDSSELFVAAELPVDSLMQNVTRGSASVDMGFALLTSRAQVALRDSSRTEIEAGDAEFARTRSWSGRVPAGDYAYRVEGRGVASQRVARGSGVVAARAASGFGTSDVLVAAKVDPNPSTAGARWTDYAVIPSAGVFARGAPVALLWETYDLGARDGAARYRVAVTVARRERGGVLGFAARIVGGVAGAVGRDARTEDGRLELSFDRQAAARPVTTDYLTLDLAGAAAGTYDVKVTVTDATSGRSASSSTAFRIVEPTG